MPLQTSITNHGAGAAPALKLSPEEALAALREWYQFERGQAAGEVLAYVNHAVSGLNISIQGLVNLGTASSALLADLAGAPF
jgi:hypothetical protein